MNCLFIEFYAVGEELSEFSVFTEIFNLLKIWFSFLETKGL